MCLANQVGRRVASDTTCVEWVVLAERDNARRFVIGEPLGPAFSQEKRPELGADVVLLAWRESSQIDAIHDAGAVVV